MTMVAEKQLERIGTTSGREDHDYDLVHELNKRLCSLWRCNQYIANAEGNAALQSLWRDIKRQEQDNVKRIKPLIAEEIRNGRF